MDGRFLQLSDAKAFYERFCHAFPCHIVGIATGSKYYEILANELKDSNSHGLMAGERDSGRCLGSDILGWDISGFHSFLCNSLQKELPDARFNEIGLLENAFHQVAGFAHQIEGKGEPVEWIPCRISAYE